MSVLLSDLKLVLPDLLEKKRPLVEGTNTGKTYLPLLQAQLDAIDTLPAGTQGGTPLANKLAETDAEHDGFGGAVWHLVEAYARCPAVSDEIRAAAERIRAQFIPVLGELQHTYAVEADRARGRTAVLDDFKTDLKLFPVAEKQTLYDWVKGYLEAGLALKELLSERADAPLDSRAGAGPLRTRTLGILSRMRGALADEVAANEKLPRDLETQVFAFFDQRAALMPKPKKRGKQPVAPGAAPDGEGTPPKG
jgi:hypothetical protein